ncbi:MAG TPA: M81 family metallopeptidase [Alcaligenaceae bacterium]|nr:M81 family metallopeptidase [Alcaligenaceae bacterium]
MAKIVYGGFQHETNTFAPDLADWEAFLAGGGWPALCSGHDVWPSIKGANIPAAGFVAEALAAGHEVVPTIWCAASPSAHVEKNTYERISALIVDGIKAALPVDAVYLDLHGAMVAQHFDDGEGELIRRIRECVGETTPIIASLDLHANVTQQMLNCSDALVAYRTYPHVDMAETGARAFKLLEQRLAQEKKPAMAMRRLPFLVPICWQSTDIEPARSLYKALANLETESTHLSFATGFPAADFPECSPVIWAYANTEAEAQDAVNQLADQAELAEAQFAGKLYAPLEAVQYAIQESENSAKPIVIADAQDNPGAGSNSDTTGMLRALIEADAQDAAIGLIVDPESARLAHAAGEGATIRLSLGGKSGITDDSPLTADFLVETLSDGLIDATGPFYKGFKLNLGLCASLRIGGIRIVLASQKIQMADQALFRVVGIDPTQQRILVVKSAVHFRADFTPIAKEIIVATAPGSMPMVLENLPWKNLKPGIRIDPKGTIFLKK